MGLKKNNMDKNTKILIADDSAFMRKIVKDILEGMGFSNFVEAENGKQAIEKFNTEKPDLVLLDVIMPEMDGVETLKQIGKKTKVIMVSAIGQDSIIKDAKESGAVGYIVKPFEKDKVVSEIEKVLG